MKHLALLTVLLTLFVPFCIDWSGGSDVPVAPSDHASAYAAGNGTDPIGLYGGMVGYDDVVLLVNDNSPISLDIGTYFAGKRGIPPLNIINLSVPAKETISPAEYDELARQVSENLSDRGLTESTNYLVTTKGVPLRVSGDNWRMASVDSELMLLDSRYENTVHGSGWIDNPYFDTFVPFSRERYGIRLVTRLTGYTAEEAKRLVDLADASFGVRGRALLDLDPRKDGSGGYRIANEWMRDAHDWLIGNGHESLLDENNTFRTDWTNTSAYYSWGSNDGSWGSWLLRNSNFESGTGPIPSDWTLYNGSVAERSQENVDANSWSLKLRDSLAVQFYDLEFLDHRYIFDGRIALSGVDDGNARAFVQGYDGSGKIIYFKEFHNRTGSRSWESFQGVVENRSDLARLKIGVQVTGSGTAYFDNVALRVIRPHNEWVPGAIAETCVSTGGRSMTYGTWYGQSLVSDLIRDGVTGVKGYTWEPFLSAISHADILFPAYYQSYNLAESFWMGSEFGSWMGTVIGDPKCTPYLDLRGDMGFNETPFTTGVDKDGYPYLELHLFNKGKAPVQDGQADLYMDGELIDSQRVFMDPSEGVNITYAYRQMPVDIQGRHDFVAVLNSDGKIWDMDEGNDEHGESIVVNTMPSVRIDPTVKEVVRSGEARVNVTVHDRDGIIDEQMSFTALDPDDRPVRTELVGFLDLGQIGIFTFDVDVPHDSPTGMFELTASYSDTLGSSDTAVLKGAFRAVNALPDLNGTLSSTLVPRGEGIEVLLVWSDADTPSGDLEVSASVIGEYGTRLDIGEMIEVSSHSGLFNFTIPSRQPAQDWLFEAKVTDRDKETDTWSGWFATENRAPALSVVSGLPADVTRSEEVRFEFLYEDPEGLDPVDLILLVQGGQAEDPTVISQELDAVPGLSREVILNPGSLPVGTYDVTLSCMDDSDLPAYFLLEEAIVVRNIPASITDMVFKYPFGEGDPGGAIVRSGTFTIEIRVDDPDDPLGLPDVRFAVDGGNGPIEVPTSREGAGIFRARIDTTGLHPGEYSVKITVSDDMGVVTERTIDPAFIVQVPDMEMVSGSVRIDGWGRMNASVIMKDVPGMAGISNMTMVLRDDNSTEVTLVLSHVGGLEFRATMFLQIHPTSAIAIARDDLGIDHAFDEGITIQVDPRNIEGTGEGSDGGDPTLILALSAVLILLFVLAVIALFLFFRRRSMRPGPPAGTLPVAPGPEGIAPGVQPPPIGQGPAPAQLTDGSIYHPPSAQVEAPKDAIPQAPLPGETPQGRAEPGKP